MPSSPERALPSLRRHEQFFPKGVRRTSPTAAHLEFLTQVLAIAAKDLSIERRSRERVLAAAAFSALVVLLFALAFDRTGAGSRELAAPVIWMTLVFGGLLAVARTFHLEREDDALTGLLQSPAPRDAIYLGKTLANAVVVFPLTTLVLVAFALLFGTGFPTPPAFGLTLVALSLGALAFVAHGTLLAVISTGARSGDALLLVLVLPLAVPVVIFGVDAVSASLAGRLAEAVPAIRWLGGFALVSLFSGAVLFRYLVEE